MASEQELHNLRHSCAHLLAAAVQKFWPEVKLGVGPAIEDGFYYDFDLDHKLSPEDLAKIEDKMDEIQAQGLGYEREEVSIAEAKKRLKAMGQPYKVELVKLIEKTGSTAVTVSDAGSSTSEESSGHLRGGPAGAKPVTFYKTGDFIDLCRGGHVKNTKEIGPFKLLSIAGAYWRGDEKNPQLQRIYGTCWPTQAELDNYLAKLEEAKKRDHRKLGQELDLFAFSDLVGAGLPLFTPKGTVLRRELENFVWSLMEPHGYQRVTIPHIAKVDLYKTSGHYEKFNEDTFHVRSGREDSADFVLKSMNCPHHTQIYASRPRSYRDLPIRFAETTAVYRDEYSGELHGLTRVRALTQDDAHLFCRMDQVADEVSKLYQTINQFYQTFGMELAIRLSVRDPKHPEQYLGSDAHWAQAEQVLTNVLNLAKVEFVRSEGNAAFYGPKIDFIAKDSLNRNWQLATIQVDFNQPERFKLSYTDAQGRQQRPVMVHRAILGTVERFLGIIIEHYAGAFPTWLAPVQVKLIPISEKVIEYTKQVASQLQKTNIRFEVADANVTLGKNIRDAQLQKIPYMLILGAKEADAGTVAVRSRDQGDLGSQTIDTFTKRLLSEIRSRQS